MLRFLIVDDHPSFRRGVKDILVEGFKGAGFSECGNAQEMLDQVRLHAFDLVVMDISMPGRSGPEVLKELKGLNSTVPVLILSMHPEDQYAIRMFKAGAAGYLTKSSAPEELVQAAKKVLAGGVSSEFRKYNHPHALFYTHGKGSRVYDVDGNEYLDFTLSQGPLILGHSHPDVIQAITDYSANGQLFAGQHIREIELAEKINATPPSGEPLVHHNLDEMF